MTAHAKVRASGPIGQTLLEVLGSVMTPEMRDEVVRVALARAGRTAIPENVYRLRELAEGPLRQTVIELVGLDAAQSLTEDLDPILQVAESGVRPRREAPTEPRMLVSVSKASTDASYRSFPRPRRTGETLQLVVVTQGSLEALKNELGIVAVVSRVRDAFGLQSAIEDRRGPVLVIVDGHRRAVEVETLATFLPHVPEGVSVLLWGFDPAETERVTTHLGWSRLEAPDSWASLAEELRRRSRASAQPA